MKTKGYSISEIEELTGISKESLRIWERRYKFPNPSRDASGDRLYSSEEAAKLSIVSKLMNHGQRPGGLVEKSFSQLKDQLEILMGRIHFLEETDEENEFLVLVQENKQHEISQFLERKLLQDGLRTFLIDFIQRMNIIIGQNWEKGELSVFQEHLYSELVKSITLKSISQLPESKSTKPSVLITTIQDEMHHIGILMVYCILRLNGFPCVYLGPNLCNREITMAAKKFETPICALSVSSSYRKQDVDKTIQRLIAANPEVEFWIGGAGVGHIKNKDKQMVCFTDFQSFEAFLESFD